MTDIFGNILTQMSSAFNNKNKEENLDVQLNKDKTLKWRGLHNNQSAASKKRGGTATNPSSSPRPSTKISNGDSNSTTTADGTLCEAEMSGCNAEVNDEICAGGIRNDEVKIDETKQPSTVTNQSESIVVNADNTMHNSSTNSNENTIIANDFKKEKNIFKYHTRNQRQRCQTITEPDNVIASSLYRVDCTEPSVYLTSELQQTTPPLKFTKRKIISDSDETQTSNKIQLRGRTVNVSSSITQTSVIDSVEATAFKNSVYNTKN